MTLPVHHRLSAVFASRGGNGLVEYQLAFYPNAGRDCFIARAVDNGCGCWASLKRVVDDRSRDGEIVVRQS
jgi:hypothetical protein